MSDVNFLEFEAEIANLYAESDVVVSQAGYNTVCELLSFSRRAILVPRSEPVREQLIRARLMAERGFFECIEPQDLTSETLISKVRESLNASPITSSTLDLGRASGHSRACTRATQLPAEGRMSEARSSWS